MAQSSRRNLNINFLRRWAGSPPNRNESSDYSRRDFLASAVTSVGSAFTGNSQFDLSGGLTLEASRHLVLLKHANGSAFSVDARRFSGTPNLSVQKKGSHIRIVLDKARFPGLRTSADFVLDLWQEHSSWNCVVEFESLGLVVRGDLVSWLQRQEGVPTRLKSGLTLVAGPEFDLGVRSGAAVQFTRDWTIRFSGPSALGARYDGKRIEANEFVLNVVSEEETSFVRSMPKRWVRGQLRHPSGKWDVNLPAMPELRAHLRATNFDRLTFETGESRNLTRLGLMFEQDQNALALGTAADLSGNGHKLELPLANLKYVTYPDTGETYVAADLSSGHHSLLTGAFEHVLQNREGVPFFEAFSQGKSAPLTAAVQPAVNVDVHLPGAIVRTVRPPAPARFRLTFGEFICDLREALHIFPEKQVAYTMSDSLEIELLRPRDLLVLKMKFRGMHFVHREGKTWLAPGPGPLAADADAVARTAARCRARLIAEFQPQMISEEAACEDSVDIQSAPSPPIRSCIAGPSRLVFRPFNANSAERIPFELENLLSWSGWGLNVSNLAAPPLLADGTFSPDGRLEDGFSYRDVHPALDAGRLAAQCLDSTAKPTAPAVDETAIEAPEGLVISPNRYAVFDVIGDGASEREPESAPASVRAALWHARLRTPEPPPGTPSPQPDQCPLSCGQPVSPAKTPKPVPGSKPRYPATRIVWAAQIDPAFDKTRYPLFQRSAAITPSDQISLAQAFVKWDPMAQADNLAPYYPPAMPTSLLVLSARGAWMRGAVTWQPLFGTNLSGLSLRLAEGHNEKTVIAKDGFLTPCGHASTLIKETSRKWVSLNGSVYSYEVMVCYLTFPEKTKQYPAVGQANGARDLCYQSWTITIDRTPNLDFPHFPGEMPSGGCDCNGEAAFWPVVMGVAYRIPFSSVDQAAQTCSFSMPAMWVPSNIGLDTNLAQGVQMQYNVTADREWTTELNHDANPTPANPISKRLTVAEMHSQKIALAPPSKPGNTQSAVDRIFWSVTGPTAGTETARRKAQQPGWYPTARRLTVADDNLQAISNPSAMLGQPAAGGLIYLNYFSDYVTHGFPSNSAGKGMNRGEVYLSVVNEKLSAPPAIDFAAKQSGSVAVPSAPTIGFSRSLGPVGGKVTTPPAGPPQTTLGDLFSGNFDPVSYFDGKFPKLLGVIDLIQIIAAVTGLDDQLDRIPKLIPTEIRDLAGAIENAAAQVQQAIDTANTIATVFQSYQNQAAGAVATLQAAAITAATSQLTAILGYVDIPPDFIGTAAEVNSKVQQARGTIAQFQTIINNTKDLSTVREYLVARITANGVLDPGDVDTLRQLFQLKVSASQIAAVTSALANARSQIGNGLAAGQAIRKAAADLATAAKNKDANGLAAALNEMQQALELLLGGTTIAARATTEVASVQQQLKSQASTLLMNATADYATLTSALMQYKNGLFAAETAIVQTKITAFQMQAQSLLETANDSINSFIDQAATQLNAAVAQTLGVATDLDAKLQPALDLIQTVLALIQLPKEIDLDYTFSPQLQDDPTGVFKADYNGNSATLDIAVHVAKKLDGSAPTFQTNATLQNFRLVLLPFLNFVELRFSRVGFSTGSSGGTNVSVKLAEAKFLGPFDFIQQLEQELGFLDSDSGPILSVDASGVTVGLQFGIPTIECGMFLMTGMSFSAGITLPFDGKSAIVASFAFATRDAPAILAFEIFGGEIYMGLKLSAQEIVMVEAALAFGAIADIDLVVASGSVSIMGGFYYRKDTESTTLSGFFRASGELTVLDLISMSMQFWLSLSYEERTDGAWLVGECTVQVEISFAFFSVGASVTMRREFSRSGGNTGKLAAPIGPDVEPFETLADEWEAEYLRKARRYA